MYVLTLFFINVNLGSKGLVAMWKSVRRKEFSKSADREVSFFATSFKEILFGCHKLRRQVFGVF